MGGIYEIEFRKNLTAESWRNRWAFIPTINNIYKSYSYVSISNQDYYELVLE